MGLLIALPAGALVRGTSAQAPAFRTDQACLLYEADFGHGIAAWNQYGPGQWQARGGILSINDSSPRGYGSMIVAPYRVVPVGYTVVARVRVVKLGSQDANQVGVVVRVSDALDRASHLPRALLGGFARTAPAAMATIHTLGAVRPDVRQDTGFSPGDTWHTVQVQIRASNVGLLIDGRTTLQTTWRGFSGDRRVGLFVHGAHLEVSSFQVKTLPYAGSQLVPASCPSLGAPRATAR
jgi:hypothetical protein